MNKLLANGFDIQQTWEFEQIKKKSFRDIKKLTILPPKSHKTTTKFNITII